ncbi:hypothetical protein Pan44_03050 [Caulifigura coniformis]|uniref:DUF2314 domain-containing protein n=2 Tax=Caulifigura coniformis TaxID=2527983 RepID=A0A517S853_9PLAN|nr:hypothetical protein Pan44_03050 [Caulifigura coniformis]
MVLMQHWTKGERRGFLGGMMLFVAGSAGLLTLDDALQAENARKRHKPEIRQTSASPQEEEMEKAMDEAVDKLDNFLAVLKTPKKNQEQFAIKFFVELKDDAELLWLNELKFEKGVFTGKLANQPALAKHLKMGETLKVKEDDVVDWMYVEDGKLQGGYTIRVQRKYVQAAERKKFDDQFKFKFE